MTLNIEKEIKDLSQVQFLDTIKQNTRTSEMLTVYFSKNTKYANIGIYCALIPTNQIECSLGSSSWDLMHRGGLPGAIIYHKDGGQCVKYLRFGDDSGVEPLIVNRYFSGMRQKYSEICEEFRLFHNLYHDRETDRYIKFNEAGNEEIVADVKPGCIQIRLKEIKQFLAIKEMHLALFFDCVVSSEKTLQELNIEKGTVQKSEDLLVYRLSYGDHHGLMEKHAFSRLLGKHLIPPFPKEKSGFWGFDADETMKCLDFIIDVDEDGEDVTHTSNPDTLANYSGKNEANPRYLTPVYFSRDVLDKYFKKPSKYTVEDGCLRCGSLWLMRIDNHHDDKVIVWLGDLGRDLPYSEQHHWKGYNIQPRGTISETTFRRAILGEFADSENPEHIFPQIYYKLQEDSQKILHWPILLPLDKGDEHYLQAIRIPSDDEQKDFDELVQALAKVLIDSLNEKKLNSLIPEGERMNIRGGISRLERAFGKNGAKDYEAHIKFLRDLQDLRSSGSAHRKGKEYRKIAEIFGINNQSLRTVFQGILERSIEVLQFLDMVVKNGHFLQENDSGGAP